MKFLQSCEAVSAKCVFVPLLSEVMEGRPDALGRLGPCVFKTPDVFFTKVLGREELNGRYIQTPIILDDPDQLIVAIGDIHGDILVLLGALYLLGVIDDRARWIGGNTIVAQCGDLLDRSGRSSSIATNNVREEVDIVQYLHSLNKSANQSGGGYIWCLGNHDIARVLWKEFEGKELWVEDSDQQNKRTPDYRKYIGNQVKGWGGKKKMKALFQPGGKMAIYMSHYAVFIIQINWFVFMHGGLTIDIVQNIKKSLNIRDPQRFFGMVNRNLSNALEMGAPLNPYVKSISWNREYSSPKISPGPGSPGNTKANRKCLRDMRVIFQETGLNWDQSAFVVGHSIQKEGTPVFCGGRVWRIDYGMSEAFSSGKAHKVVGGLSIYQYAGQKPFKVLVVMNYSTDEGTAVDRFILYVSKQYKHVVINKDDESQLTAEWWRDVDRIQDVENRRQHSRKRAKESREKEQRNLEKKQ
jgi:hypothetical protein